jgi:hypothetical protein
MPDPKECRQRAFEYVWLARVPVSPQEREAYLKLANIWLRLAKDLTVDVVERDGPAYKKAS